MVPSASPGGTAVLAALIVAGGALPVVFTVGIGHLTSATVRAQRVSQLISLREKHRSLSNLVTVITDKAGDLRHADYVQELSLQPEAAKEARVFGWQGWATNRYLTVWNRAMTPVWRVRRQGSPRLN